MNDDIISRSALRKDLEVTQYNDIDDLIRTEKLIDNAPTVEAYPFEQVQELVKLNQQFAEEIENLKRPQGKWINPSENPEFSNKDFFLMTVRYVGILKWIRVTSALNAELI